MSQEPLDNQNITLSALEILNNLLQHGACSCTSANTYLSSSSGSERFTPLTKNSEQNFSVRMEITKKECTNNGGMLLGLE